MITLCGILFFSFYFSKALISISFAGIALLGLLYIKNNILSKEEKILSAFFVIFFISFAVSFFYSHNESEAIRKIILKLPILLFPLLLISFKKLNSTLHIWLAIIFNYSIFFVASISVYNYLINQTYYDDLILQSKPIPILLGYGIYHIQFSILLACAILLGIFFSLKNNFPIFIKYAIVILTILNLVCIHVLSTRTGLLAMYCGLLILLAYFYLKVSAKQKVILFSLIISVPLVAYLLSSSLQKRFDNTLSDLKVVINNKDANDHSFAMRVKAWGNAADVINKNKFCGVGIGDADSVLYANFSTYNPTMEARNRRNPHFQFLETWVQSGVISAVLILGLIFYIFFSKFAPIVKSIAVLLLVSSCFESILERQVTVVAFSLFIALSIAISSHLKKHNA